MIKPYKETVRIIYVGKGESFDNGSVVEISEKGKQRKHPIYMFVDKNDNYICEVYYGVATTNAYREDFGRTLKMRPIT